MKLLQFPKHWWKYPIRLTVMEKFLWKTSSMEDRNFQSFRFLDYVYLCRRLQRNIGMKGCREKPTRTERREPIEVFSLKTDYDTIFGSAGMWNAYGYRMG